MARAITRIRESGLRTAALTNNWPRADGGPSTNGDALGFDVIIESAVVGLRKPDPLIYELALTRARGGSHRHGVPRRSRDQPQTPRAMGMTTIKVVDPDLALSELAATLGFEVH